MSLTRARRRRRHPWIVSAPVLVTTAALAATGLVLGSPAQPARADPPAGAGWQLAFNDDFDGTALDTTKWNLPIERNWHSGYNTAQAIDVAGGNLTITTFTDPAAPAGRNKHYSAGIAGGDNERTGINKSLLTYGYAEARIKYADSQGTRSSWWLYTPDINLWDSEPYDDSANAGDEVDIIEHTAASATDPQRDKLNPTLHWDGYRGGHKSLQLGEVNWADVDLDPGAPVVRPTSLQGNYHNYSVEWTPTTYIFRIDGVEIRRTSRQVSHRPLFPILSTELVGTQPASYGTKATSTTKMTVDYVKVWQKPVVAAYPSVTTTPGTPVAVPLTVTQKDGVTTNVTVSSTNPSLTTHTAVTGTGADRTLVVYPSGTATGTADLTVTATGAVTGSTTVRVTVSGSAASPPSYDAVPPQTSVWGTPVTVPVLVPSASTVTLTSDNPSLVPSANLSAIGPAQRRALTVTPLPTRTGTARITVNVSGNPAATFPVTVHAGTLVNPGFEAGGATADNWAFAGDAARVTTGQRTGAAALRGGVFGIATQTVQGLEPNTTYIVGGWGRLAAAGGAGGIAVRNFDTAGTTAATEFTTTTYTEKSASFTTGPTSTSAEILVGDYDATADTVLVDDVYLFRSPAVTPIANVTTAGGVRARVPFSVGRVGASFPASQLTVSSSNPAVVASSGISIGTHHDDTGDPFQKLLSITPVAGASGLTTISVKARDQAGREVVETFQLAANAGTLRNGDFEFDLEPNAVADHGLEGWTTVSGTVGLRDLEDQRLHLGSGAYAQQVVTGLQAGRRYRLTATLQAFQTGSPGSGVAVGVKGYGGAEVRQLSTPTPIRTLSLEFTPTSTTATVFLTNTSTTAADGWANDVTLVPVP